MHTRQFLESHVIVITFTVVCSAFQSIADKKCARIRVRYAERFKNKNAGAAVTRRFALPTYYHNNIFIDFVNNTQVYVYRDACPAHSARLNVEGAARPPNPLPFTVSAGPSNF